MTKATAKQQVGQIDINRARWNVDASGLFTLMPNVVQQDVWAFSRHSSWDLVGMPIGVTVGKTGRAREGEMSDIFAGWEWANARQSYTTLICMYCQKKSKRGLVR